MLEKTEKIEKSYAEIVVNGIKNLKPLFLICVLIPTIVSSIYFGLIASDVYISESKFIVRAQGKQAPTGLASLLIGGDLGGSGGGDSGAVREYALSRDALSSLNSGNKIREIYNRPEIDFINKLDSFKKTSFEDMYKYYGDKVFVESDNKTGVILLKVEAYRPEDAHWLNEHLLRQSEALVNKLNTRMRSDTVRYAKEEVIDAQQRARQAAQTLASYRDKYGIIDPEKQATASLQMISKLQDELIATNATLAQTKAVAPENPQIEVYQARASSLQSEINDQMSKLAGGRGSLAGKAADYTRWLVESQFADKLLATAMASLENANNEARRQQVYIERIVQPDKPDEALKPERLRGVIAVLAIGLVAWGVLAMLLAAMREHQQ